MLSAKALKYVLVIGMLITGSINTLSKKAANDMRVEGLDYDRTHQKEDFKKPWAQTMVMFSGEMMCMLGYWFSNWRERKNASAANSAGPLLTADAHHYPEAAVNVTGRGGQQQQQQQQALLPPALNETSPFLFLFPACCDLLGTTLAGIGLLYVDASVWQMLRGSIIIFSGILSVIFLKKKFVAYHWTSIGIVTIGLACVGVAGLEHAKSEHKKKGSDKAALGIALVVAGQLCSAVQMVFEETFMKGRNLKPLRVVGMEGFWGFVVMACAVLPSLYFIHGDDHGSYENVKDAWHNLKHSGELVAFTMLYWGSIIFYNFCGLSVAKQLSTVHRTLIDALRTVVVWSVELIIYYGISKSFGEAWSDWSYLQSGGFVFLVIGTLCYNKVIRLPGFNYPPDDDETPVHSSPSSSSSSASATSSTQHHQSIEYSTSDGIEGF